MTLPTPPEEKPTAKNQTEDQSMEAATVSALPASSAAPASAVPHFLAPAGDSGVTLASLLPPQARHDLRNHVGQVIGYSELWLDETEAEGETPLRQDLQRMHAAGKQILTMINALIDPVHPLGTTHSLSSSPSSAVQAAAVRPADRYKDLSHWRMPSAPAPFSEVIVQQVVLQEIVVQEATEAVPEQATGTPSQCEKVSEKVSDSAADATGKVLENAGRAASLLCGALLIVDDNEANRDMLRRRLEQQGHQITTASNGQEALERLSAQTFDVLLLDIVMPLMDGYEVLRHIKTDDTLRHLPVIMISALDEMESVIRCIEMGADDFLPKPFDPVLLQARIGACLEKKRLRDREVVLFTQLQENYLRLKELETLRDDLTHMIVHDLRTPLTSLLTGLQTLQFSERLDADDREMLDISLSGGQTLLGMINDLLDVSKMEDGSLVLAKQPIQVSALIAKALHQVAALAKEKKLALTRQVSPDVPTFAGDEEKLLRTLVNLLGNAIKFTSPGGTITVAARIEEIEEGEEKAEIRRQKAEETGSSSSFLLPPSSLIFSVRDTGEGIPRESFERIFQKFGQVESRKAGRKMSTGLGLTFCKLVVEAHGGRIWVESELGQGSTFLFAVPA
jgi:two-component system sensor histidine kinase/response regulator